MGIVLYNVSRAHLMATGFVCSVFGGVRNATGALDLKLTTESPQSTVWSKRYGLSDSDQDRKNDTEA